VLERDPSYERASSARSAASIRQQFSTPLNIALSQVGLQLLRGLGAQTGLVERGYLYLAQSAAQAERLRALNEVQRQHGATVRLLEPAALRVRWPWLQVADLSLGSWGEQGEGWFDGWGLLMHLRARARAAGVEFLHAEALALERDASGALCGVQTAAGQLQAERYVLACGAWSGRLAATAGLDVPVTARRRSVYAFRSPETAHAAPLLIDPSGLWFRPEGEPGQFICGGTPLDDRPDQPLDPEADLFEDHLWPALAARVPGFESLRPERAWAGYYEMNDFDHNGLVGALPECPNLLLACGFSGHGLQHAPGVGRGLAEWLARGGYESLDLSLLSPARLRSGERYVELNVI
jgi:glycine/D-amino acid oxidase-like deaminating enzyme